MQTIKTWIRNSNGWQRLWLVGVVATHIYLGIIVPLQDSSSYSQSKFADLRRIEAEMKKTECEPYLRVPFNQLPTDANITMICFDLFYERKRLKNDEPFSLKAYETEMNATIRSRFIDDIKLGLLVAIFLSILIYGLGTLTAWVIKGFRKKDL
jgi:hypothetical protein